MTRSPEAKSWASARSINFYQPWKSNANNIKVWALCFLGNVTIQVKRITWFALVLQIVHALFWHEGFGLRMTIFITQVTLGQQMIVISRCTGKAERILSSNNFPFIYSLKTVPGFFQTEILALFFRDVFDGFPGEASQLHVHEALVRPQCATVTS